MSKDKINTSRITFCIDENRHIAFKMLALSQRKTVENILNQMIQKYLDDEDLERDKVTFQKCFKETESEESISWDEFNAQVDWQAP